jgi:putative endonuclease
MSYYVYIIYSKQLDTYYTGQTNNIETRLNNHLSGISKFTARAKDWVLVHHETFNSRTEAIQRENAIKKKKSRKYIEWIIAMEE